MWLNLVSIKPFTFGASRFDAFFDYCAFTNTFSNVKVIASLRSVRLAISSTSSSFFVHILNFCAATIPHCVSWRSGGL
jgi:hypothetical protein